MIQRSTGQWRTVVEGGSEPTGGASELDWGGGVERNSGRLPGKR